MVAVNILMLSHRRIHTGESRDREWRDRLRLLPESWSSVNLRVVTVSMHDSFGESKVFNRRGLKMRKANVLARRALIAAGALLALGRATAAPPAESPQRR